jgi:hypothetical protein
VGESLLELALLGGPLLGGELGELGERAAGELVQRCHLVPARKTPRQSAKTGADGRGAKTEERTGAGRGGCSAAATMPTSMS